MKHQVNVYVFVSRDQDWNDKENGYPYKWSLLLSRHKHEERENLVYLNEQSVSIEAPDLQNHDFRELQLRAVEAELTRKRAEAYKEIQELEATRNRLLAIEN